MKRFIWGGVALLVLTFVAMPAPAEAQGFHFNSGRFHFDVGNPHGNAGCGYGGYRGYGGYNAYRPQRDYGGHHFGGGRSHVWHDTSHYDWHPTEYRRHRNHIDVIPGHYDWHQEGHVDHLHP